MAGAFNKILDRTALTLEALLATAPESLQTSASIRIFSQSEPLLVYNLASAHGLLDRQQRRRLRREGSLILYESAPTPSILIALKGRHRSAATRIPMNQLADWMASGDFPSSRALLLVNGVPVGSASLRTDEQVVAFGLVGTQAPSASVDGLTLAYAPTRVQAVGVLVKQSRVQPTPAPETTPTPRPNLLGGLGHREIPLLALLFGAMAVILLRSRKPPKTAPPPVDLKDAPGVANDVARLAMELKATLTNGLAVLDLLMEEAGIRKAATLQDNAALVESLKSGLRTLAESATTWEADQGFRSPVEQIQEAALDIAVLSNDHRSFLESVTTLRSVLEGLQRIPLISARELMDLERDGALLAGQLVASVEAMACLGEAERWFETAISQAHALYQQASQVKQALKARVVRAGLAYLQPQEDAMGAKLVDREGLRAEADGILKTTVDLRNALSQISLACEPLLDPASLRKHRISIEQVQAAKTLKERLKAHADAGRIRGAGDRQLVRTLEQVALHLEGVARNMAEGHDVSSIASKLRAIAESLQPSLEVKLGLYGELQGLSKKADAIAWRLEARAAGPASVVPLTDVTECMEKSRTQAQALRERAKQLKRALETIEGARP